MSITIPKWALVTGAARRIGRAIALRLATDGWNIVVHYNQSAEEATKLAEEIMALNRQAVLAEIDLVSAEHVTKLIPSLAAALGPITALINNASLFEPDAKDPNGVLHHAINAEAPRLLSEAFCTQVPDDQDGSIINLLDGMPPEQGFAHYNRSKIELRKAMLEQAKRFAPRVRVNGIAPGPTLPSPRQSAEHFQKLVTATPLKIQTTPDDIARAASFLLNSPAITDEIIHVNGGMNLDNL